MDRAEFARLLEVAANEGIEERNGKPEGARFGDILSNGWMSNRNPLKLFMYLRTDKHIEGVSLDGRRIQQMKNGNLLVRVLPRDTPNYWQVWAELAAALAVRPDQPRPDATTEQQS